MKPGHRPTRAPRERDAAALRLTNERLGYVRQWLDSSPATVPALLRQMTAAAWPDGDKASALNMIRDRAGKNVWRQCLEVCGL